MANYNVPEIKLTAIADAIRAVNQSNDKYTLDAMVNTINAIPTYKKLYSTTYTINNTSTTTWTTLSPTIDLGSNEWTTEHMLYIKVRDTLGLRASHYLGCDAFYSNYRAFNNSTSNVTGGPFMSYYSTSSSGITVYAANASSGYGLCPSSLTPEGILTMRHRYNATYTPNFNSIYSVEIFSLPWPHNGDPWYST